jgi:hypothetical protein
MTPDGKNAPTDRRSSPSPALWVCYCQAHPSQLQCPTSLRQQAKAHRNTADHNEHHLVSAATTNIATATHPRNLSSNTRTQRQDLRADAPPERTPARHARTHSRQHARVQLFRGAIRTSGPMQCPPCCWVLS